MNIEKKGQNKMSLKLLCYTKWLRFFTRTYKDKNGQERTWDFCSRKENPDEITTRADAVVVVPFLEDGRMVLIRQFRPSINNWVIENVAGLVDKNDPDIVDSAMREMLEEVGLKVRELKVYHHVLYNSVGLTDESVSYVFCKAKGEPHTKNNEESENIEILAIDRQQAKNICDGYITTKISAKCWLVLQAYANGFDWFEME